VSDDYGWFPEDDDLIDLCEQIQRERERLIAEILDLL
jgi:hypothetical protein